MKRALIIIISIVALLLVAVIVLPIVFKGKIVEIVKQQANENLNAKVQFDNDIELSLFRNFPAFTLGISNLSVTGINEFEGDTLIALKKFSATIDIMSVIKGDQIKIRSIMLDQPNVHALVLKDGKANWDIAKPSTDTTTTETDTAATAFNIALKKFSITDGNVVYDDNVMGVYTKASGLNFELKGDFTQDNFLLQTLTSVKELTLAYGGVNYLTRVNTNIKADLDANMPEMKFAFKENEIKLNALTFGFDGFVQMMKEDIIMDIKYEAPKSEFKSFISLIPAIYSKDFDNLKTAGKLGFNGFVKGTYNEKQMPAFALNLLVENGMFQYPALPAPVNNVQVNLAVTNPDGNLNNTKIDLSKFHAEVAGDAFDAKLLAVNVMKDPTIDSWLKGKINLGNITKIVPLEGGTKLAGIITADVSAKGAVSAIEKQQFDQFDAKGQLSVAGFSYLSKDLPQGFDISNALLTFSPQLVRLNNFAGKLGKSDLNMNGQVSNFFPYVFSKGILKGELNFHSNLIDANEFITGEETPAAKPETVDTASVSAPEIPSNIDFTLNSRINKLLYTNMEITNFAGAVKVAEQKLSFVNVGLNTLGAAVKMDGYYETTNPVKPTMMMDFGVQNLDIQKAATTFNTIQKMAPITEKMKGSFSTTFKMNTTLTKQLAPVYETLFAEGLLTIPNAEISGVKVFEKAADALKNDKLRKFAISNVKIQFKVEKGRVYTKPFDMNVAGQKITMSGSTGLDQTIDYTGKVAIPRKDLGAANDALNKALSDLNKKAGSNIKMSEIINVDLIFGGTFTNPTVSTNLADLAKKEAGSLKDQAAEELERQKKLAEEKAKAEIEKKKKELEDKAKAEIDKAKKEAEEKAKAEQERLKKQAEEEAKKKLKGIFKKP